MSAKSSLWMLAVVMISVFGGCERPSAPAAADEGDADSGRPAIGVADAEAAGIRTERAARQDVREVMVATGWLVARPDREVVVRAPLTGFVAAPDDSTTPVLGRPVGRDDSLGVLHVFLSPQEQADLVVAKEDADTAIKQSAASLEIARDQLASLEQNAPSAVSGTRLQQLREIVARSQAARDEALQKLPFLPEEPYGDAPRLKPTPIRSPIEGRIVQLHVTPRQLVLQGEPLWTVADWSSLWVRAPVFVGDLPRIAGDAAAEVAVPGTDQLRLARAVALPQPTDPGTQTVDTYYEIDNSGWELRPGQAVSVSLPTGRASSQLTVPKSAVLWDGAGDAWVYVRGGPESFRRRRVELGQFLDDRAVVLRGVEEGEEIVAAGAEALYGEEFRSEIPVEDEDDD